ncbi:MAG: Ger(x)C family spore germination protein [Tissierellaceae bacterium]
MKKIILIFTALSMMLISGCWDMAEINERIFPYTVGVDLNPDKGDKYLITVSYPNIFAIGKNASQEERIYIISSTSSTIFEGIRKLNTIIPYPLYFKHLGTIVIGREFAQDEASMRELMDSANRDFSISRKIRLITAEDLANQVLCSIPIAVRQEAVDGTLFNMLKGDKRTARYTPHKLTKFLQEMEMTGSTIIPRVAFHGEDIKIFGGCVYKDFKFIGHLGEKDNGSIALLRGEVKETSVESPFEDILISYAVTSTKTRKKLDVEDEDLKIKIHVETEGILREYTYKEKSENLDPDTIKKMEEELSKVLEEETKKAIEILQKDLKADALGIAEYLQKFHPKVWKEVSDDWEEIFPEITIEPVIKVKIRRRGLTG